MSAEEFKAQGNAAFAAKDYEKAIDSFTKAIEVSPTPNHVLYSNRSACYASLKKYEEALKDAEECVKINPTWAKGYNRVAAAEYGLEKLDDAKKSYEKALELDPSNAMAKSGLDAITDAKMAEGDPTMGMAKIFSDPNLIDKLKANPKTAELMKDPALVEKVKKLRTNPASLSTDMFTDQRLMTVLAAILGVDMSGAPPAPEPTGSAEPAAADVEMKDAEPAKTAEPVPEPAPEPVKDSKVEADGYKAEANALYKQKKFDQAIELYNKAWETHKDITYLNNRAAAEFEKGDYDAAIQTCKTAVEEGREMRADYKLVAKSFARIGNSYLKKDELKLACEFFEKSLTEHRTPEVLNKLRATEKEAKKREAESYIDKDLAEKARLDGKEAFTKGDWPGAVKAYTEMIKRDPSDVRGYSNRAASLAKLMSFPDAIRDCETAIKLDPTFVRAYIRKANAELAIKEYRKCLETLAGAREAELKNNSTANLNEIESLTQKANSLRFAPLDGETYEETMARIQKDPEVVQILSDPVMQTILQQAQNNPAALQEHMRNPDVSRKIMTLMAAGIIRTR
ncbi:hypothetical protein OGAPHI_003325 [Ogataea philodendri]|uniref:STI1 domain-containing protein n=1 Tax=Ogataea philodendri TaxID=1378263 RepID=A0A9P8T6E2_9ASCO|nr:uncharacterized protein OGAPHI_003325 [Ogataea philodendri]KAH3666876.1 hypothetical protein OGAPHI_003325 [Ogataea philodendri]